MIIVTSGKSINEYIDNQIYFSWMPFREVILTKRLFTLKMKKLQKTRRDLYIRSKPEMNKNYLKLLNQSIDNNVIYCKGCGDPIDESCIGQTIIINRNTTSYMRKWYHVDCAVGKSIIYSSLEEQNIPRPTTTNQKNKEIVIIPNVSN
ncbi:MAG TPA: hypothetical protein VMS35_06100 [Nitrososphaeraceae archaeon]|nr:hypothetical protein [Nitrososphaeraceae archaeon]